MAIQKPNLSKFKKPSGGQGQSQKKANTGNSGADPGGDMIMNMGKAFLPMLPKKFQYVIGAAIFFLAWGLISFNYCMINWLAWGYFFAIVLVLESLQFNDEFKILKFIKKLITALTTSEFKTIKK